jgi:hypothetical protein
LVSLPSQSPGGKACAGSAIWRAVLVFLLLEAYATALVAHPALKWSVMGGAAGDPCGGPSFGELSGGNMNGHRGGPSVLEPPWLVGSAIVIRIVSTGGFRPDVSRSALVWCRPGIQPSAQVECHGAGSRSALGVVSAGKTVRSVPPGETCGGQDVAPLL